jgi:hypothetical protein
MEGAGHATTAESFTEAQVALTQLGSQEKYKRVQTQLPVASKPAMMTRFTTAISIFTTAAISIFTTA